MLQDFVNRLFGQTTAAPRTEPVRLALAALLVRVARADGHYDTAEKARIEQVLITGYRLKLDEAALLRTEAEVLETRAADTVGFTRSLKENVALDDRAALVQALWSVALAHGGRDAAEEAMIRLVASLLGVTDVQSAQARQRAQGAGGR